MTTVQEAKPEVYQGQFGEFTITASDRQGVLLYRAGLMVVALSFAIGSGWGLWQGFEPGFLQLLTPLYACFCLALGLSLLTIHIYLAPLHRALQGFWAIGCLSSIAIAASSSQALALAVYQQPIALIGIGFTFAALTGIFFKEAFCFNRLETKLLTPLVPVLLLGHLTGLLTLQAEKVLLGSWAILLVVFALRKAFQAIPDDIGDKSVFAYLKTQRQAGQAQG